jgi:hypothetical protein
MCVLRRILAEDTKLASTTSRRVKIIGVTGIVSRT